MQETYTPPQINIRKATAEDAKDIGRVRYEAWMVTYPNEEYDVTHQEIIDVVGANILPEGIETQKNLINSLGQNKNIIVATVDNRAVGYIYVIKSNNINIVQVLNVLPDFFGFGIGTQLLESGINWLGNEKPIELGVVKYNQRAIRLYEKNGFIIDGESNDAVCKLPSGKCLPECRMVKYPSN